MQLEISTLWEGTVFIRVQVEKIIARRGDGLVKIISRSLIIGCAFAEE